MVKLGRISYVNMAPVFYRVDAEVEEVQGVPTELNRMLVAGELDTAPISSIAYARNADKLRLLPRLCVASEGAVDSIQLVTRVPLEQVRTVAVTPESATSVALTKMLLPDAAQAPLEAYDTGESEAKLLIGDAALRSAFEDPTPHYDLGRLWLERTGLPMVFAVWACPEPLAEGLAEIEDALVSSLRWRGQSRSSSRTRRRCATAIPPASSRATSRSSATASARASAPACTRSSSSRATPGCSRPCRSCASCRRRERRSRERRRAHDARPRSSTAS